jgi:hypothetical protein
MFKSICRYVKGVKPAHHCLLGKHSVGCAEVSNYHGNDSLTQTPSFSQLKHTEAFP